MYLQPKKSFHILLFFNKLSSSSATLTLAHLYEITKILGKADPLLLFPKIFYYLSTKADPKPCGII